LAPTGVEQKKPKRKDQQKKDILEAVASDRFTIDAVQATLARAAKSRDDIDKIMASAQVEERRDIQELESRKSREEEYIITAQDQDALVQEAQRAEKVHTKRKSRIAVEVQQATTDLMFAQHRIEFLQERLDELGAPDVATDVEAQRPEIMEDLEKAVKIQWRAEEQLERLRGGSGLDPMPDVLPDADIGDVFDELMRSEAMELVPPVPEEKMERPPETPRTPEAERGAPARAAPPPMRREAATTLEFGPRTATSRAEILERRPLERGEAEVISPPRRFAVPEAIAARVLEVHGGGGATTEELYETPRRLGTVTQTQTAGVDMQAILTTDLITDDFPNVQHNSTIIAMHILERLGGEKKNMSKKNVKQFKKKLEELKKNPKLREVFAGFFDKIQWKRFVDQYINPNYLIFDPEEQAKDEARLRALGRYRSPTPSGSTTETEESVRSGGRRYAGGSRGLEQWLQDEPEFERSERGTYHSGRKVIQPDVADEIPESDAAPSSSGSPVRRRRIQVPQSLHRRNLRRQIHPVLRQANFSLRKVSHGRYVLTAREVTHGVVEQIRGLLQRVSGRHVTVDGRIFGKAGAFREVIRVLTEKGTVQVAVS